MSEKFSGQLFLAAIIGIGGIGVSFIQDMANRSNVLGVALWVRAGSNRFSSPCVRCRELADEGYDIYWLDNPTC